MPTVSRCTLWTTYGIMMIDVLNFGIVFPLLPSIAKQFGASATLVGSMATVQALCQMIATPILGRLSDRCGRRPVLLLALLGTTLSSVGTGLAWTFPLLVIARCVNGIMGGTVGVVNAYIADVTTKEERPIYTSYIMGANSIGIMLGPALGGLLSRWGFSMACYVSATLSFLNFLIALPMLKESRWRQADDGNTALNADGVRTVLSPSAAAAGSENPKVPCPAYFLFCSGFCLVFGFAAMESVVAYFLMDTYFNGDEKQAGQFYGVLFTCVGVVIFIVSSFVYKPVRKRLGERSLVTLGGLLRTVGFVLEPLMPNEHLFACSMMLVVTGNQFIFPTTSSLLTSMCHRSIYGRALGYQMAGQALSRVLGPMIFGTVYDKVTHAFSFYACAALTVVALGFIYCAISFSAKLGRDLPGMAEVEANVNEFEREEVDTLSKDVSSYVPAIVRQNSMERALQNSVSSTRSRECDSPS